MVLGVALRIALELEASYWAFRLLAASKDEQDAVQDEKTLKT